MERGHIQGVQDCPDFLGTPYSQERVKLRTLNLIGSITKKHVKLEKVAVGIVSETRKFLGHLIWGALRGHICDSTAFLSSMFFNLHYTVKLLIEAPLHCSWLLLKTRLVLDTRLL